jgi:hypothetical protein
VTLEFDVNETDFNIPILNAGTNYYIVYDNDGDGSLSDETPSVMTNTSGSLWEISGVNPENDRIFTIATQSSSNSIPTNISLSNDTLNENVGAGSVIGTLSTTDSDL